MAKEKFNWKGLFINDQTSEEKNITETSQQSQPSSNSFPESSKPVSKFPEQPPKTTLVSDNVLNTVIEMYESGFDSLNKPGYDFYEFFKAIKAVGSNDPSVYKMALTMAQGVDNSVTKDTLLTQADFYINEIEKVHKQYQTKGNGKRTSILNAQKVKKDTLSVEISDLEKKLIEIQNQISVKKNMLQSLDADIMSEVSEIDQKIVANDKARSKILETIVAVVNGIKSNI
ncbi:hypothetical protein [Aquimarina muelleri]|uniref:Uncharacterized protein n=1 Tax=Aquimarina muelleri TaxID=279356 RepID=A0A918JX82_9FLAO|nr:hypothetical protein [Aquimarina muelleri]MCX2764281.1 hypothetical protein [Aquimarina muelleri]GGX16159.1 hypothetical protein GCM10007384_17140 [Aquimarina muelleri]